MVEEYVFLSLYFLVTLLVALLLFGVSFFFVQVSWYYEKTSVYECGFLPFKDARGKFPVQFILFAVVFLVFDLELSFMFPWSLSFLNFSFIGFNIMVFFIIILLYGFYYEWLNGLFEIN